MRGSKTTPTSGATFTLGKARFEAFSDGVFAIAITLLILEVHLPSSISATSSDGSQAHALVAIWPQYLVYVASFATIGIMWLNHHALFHNARHITLGVIVANLFLLLVISFLPFPTAVLGQLGLSRPAVVYYGLAVSLTAVGYTLVYIAVLRAHPGAGRPFTAWNVVGLTLYPAATFVSAFVPVAGIALFIALAAFYMLPRNVRTVVLRAHEEPLTAR
jgi:TMEM175 potassium channel family protein